MSLIPYKNLNVVSPTTGDGGGTLTANFMTLADEVELCAPITSPQFQGPGSSFSFTDASTTGAVYGLAITPVYDQTSGDASNTDLLINRTETSVQSGNQFLIDAQVAGSSIFSVGTPTSDNGASIVLNTQDDSLIISEPGGVITLGTNSGQLFFSDGSQIGWSGSGSIGSQEGGCSWFFSHNQTMARLQNSDGSCTLNFNAESLNSFPPDNIVLALTIPYNQTSGSTSNTDFLINRIETAVGSGAQRLIDLQVGGTSQISVSNKAVMFIANSSSVPISNPSGGGYLYVDGGALKYRGSSGTITTIAPA